MHTGHSPEKTSRTSIALDILFVELTTNLPPKTPRKTMEPPTNKSPSIWVPLGSRSSSSLIDSPPDKFKQKFSDGRSCNYGGCGVFFLCVPGAFLGEKHGKTLQVISNLCVLFVVGIIRLQNHKYKTTNKTLRSLSEFKPFHRSGTETPHPWKETNSSPIKTRKLNENNLPISMFFGFGPFRVMCRMGHP